MKKLKICLITTFFPPYHTGGCGLHVYHLAQLLSGYGHHVEVLHCIDSFRLKRRKYPTDTLPETGFIVHRITSRIGRLAPVLTYLTGYPLTAKKKIQKILEEGFDVIHFHTISLFGGLGILGLGNAIKLFSLHTYWLLCPKHYLWKYNNEACTKKECFKCMVFYGKKLPQLWRYSSLGDRMLEQVDALIVPSMYMQKKHEDGGIDRPIYCIPHFVFPPEKKTEDSPINTPYFLYVGRLERYKGVHQLIDAFKEKKRKSRLLIAGDGQEKENLCRLAGNNDSIFFLGHVPHEKIGALYSNALALVIPSLWPEIISLVVLEALSWGIPVITSGNGGLREVIEKTQSGIIYDTKKDFVHALDMIENDETLCSVFKEKALQSYRKYYTPDVYLRRYHEIIQSLMRN